MQDRSINERKETPQIKFMNFIQKTNKNCVKKKKKDVFLWKVEFMQIKEVPNKLDVAISACWK